MKSKRSRTTTVLDALGIVYTVKGNRAWALCPYHTDASPSWFARTDKGGHHCFSCKAGGTLAGLVAHVRNCSISEAIHFVRARGKGFKPPRATVQVIGRQPDITARMYGFQVPREIVIEPLEKWPSLFRRYALEDRKITSEQVERFGLGYSIDLPLGPRLVFPVRDRKKTIVGFSARDVTDSLEQRYMTPKLSDNPDLDAIFGEHLWDLSKTNRVITVTEGAADALAVDRAVRNLGCDVGSLSGSDPRPGHASKLASFGTVILLTDNDPSGNKCASGLYSMLARHTQVWRPRLPKGTDANKLHPHELGRILRPLVLLGRTE